MAVVAEGKNTIISTRLEDITQGIMNKSLEQL